MICSVLLQVNNLTLGSDKGDRPVKSGVHSILAKLHGNPVASTFPSPAEGKDNVRIDRKPDGEQSWGSRKMTLAWTVCGCVVPFRPASWRYRHEVTSHNATPGFYPIEGSKHFTGFWSAVPSLSNFCLFSQDSCTPMAGRVPIDGAIGGH